MARTRLATDLKQSCSGCVLTDPVLFTSCDGHSRCRPWVVRRQLPRPVDGEAWPTGSLLWSSMPWQGKIGHLPSQHEIVTPSSIRLSGDGLLLGEWTETDLSALVELYDDPEIDRWTPVPSPFDSTAAGAYLARAHEGRGEGRKTAQLAITTDGEQPRGEVLLFRCELNTRDVEVAYGVGSRHRRQGLASRAVRLVADYPVASWEQGECCYALNRGTAQARLSPAQPASSSPTTSPSRGRPRARQVTLVQRRPPPSHSRPARHPVLSDLRSGSGVRARRDPRGRLHRRQVLRAGSLLGVPAPRRCTAC